MEAGHARSLYQRLNTDRREIRLLEILSESPNDKVECKLHTVPLTPETYYVCLSYVWGDPSITEEVIINGIPRQVTVSLATALRHPKKHWVDIEFESVAVLDTSRFRLWADAVCINQSDLAEKLAQVSMMADIYSSAEMVLAWISSDDQDVAGAFDIFERVFTDVKEDWNATFNNASYTEHDLERHSKLAVEGGTIQFSWLFPEASELFSCRAANLQGDDPYNHIRKIGALSFWNRVWIQQEAILANRLYYISPSHRLSHLECSVASYGLMAYMEVLTKTDHRMQLGIHWHKIQDLLKSQGQLAALCQRRAMATKAKGLSLYLEHWQVGFLRIYFRSRLEATNELDHIYGLLALTQMPIIPDYTKSIPEVYVEFTKEFVATWRRLQRKSELGDLLQVVGCLDFLRTHAVGVRRLHGLPSWAPVFSFAKWKTFLNIQGWEEHGPCVYQTVPELWNHLPATVAVTSLWAKGIKVQTIKESYHEPVSQDFMFNRLIYCVKDFLQTHEGIYINGKPILEVLCCTLLLKKDCEYDIKRLFYFLILTGQVVAPSARVLAGILQQFHRHDSTLSEWQLAGGEQEGRRLFTTEDGYIGLVRADVLPGDVVCILTGCTLPAILRPENDHYLFVGCCFMIGLLDSEVADLVASGQAKIQFIEIK
ncbi:hypothetical protein FSARC_7168 [Fusarium sarcochroum]|uniref:Heterokaryon incompatibility domain-containing protein n=1 Tax=Fusarium sarcochroum TaxID=1208366 RepID=A0A8H4TVY8_9HYPO|nr:hypothetical protein FSARC_7168 [Fusarium sarcochroum]